MMCDENENKPRGRKGHLGDLKPAKFPQVDWEDGKEAECLESIRQHLEQKAREAICWYVRAKKWKKRFGRWMRCGALVLAALAGIVPMLMQLPAPFPFMEAEPVYASILLALAAALVAIDRFFGFSSAWMRFIKAELQIQRMLDDFQLNWEIQRAAWQQNQPSQEQVTQALETCQKFAAEINGLIEEETDQWIQEFQSALKRIDQRTRGHRGEA